MQLHGALYCMKHDLRGCLMKSLPCGPRPDFVKYLTGMFVDTSRDP